MLSPESASDIVPNKAEMTTAKISTHSGINVVVYCVGKNPVLIDVDGVVYPTVYTMWKYPDLLPVFRTHSNVYSRLAGGAGRVSISNMNILINEFPYKRNNGFLIYLVFKIILNLVVKHQQNTCIGVYI